MRNSQEELRPEQTDQFDFWSKQLIIGQSGQFLQNNQRSTTILANFIQCNGSQIFIFYIFYSNFCQKIAYPLQAAAQYYTYKQQKTAVMFSQTTNAYYSPFNNDNRASYQHSKPYNLPSSSNLQPGGLSRSLSKLPVHNFNSFQSQNISNQPAVRNIARSRVSMANSQVSHLTEIINEPDVFPQQLVFLLRNEQKNINNLKEKIEKEKSRVENDFAVFRTEIDHILQDVKLSVQAELDLVYKTYITSYAELKGEVQELRIMRKEILMNSQSPYNYGSKSTSVSNKNLINEIEQDAEHMRNFRIYGYLGDLQKQKLEPINEIANQLVMIGAADCPFYKHKEMTSKFKDVKSNFGSLVKGVFDTLEDYVMTPNKLRQRDRAELEKTRTVLRQLNAAESSKFKAFDLQATSSYTQDRSTKDVKTSKDVRKTNKLNYIGQNQQGCITRWCEDIRLNRAERVQTDHSDSILCIHFVGQNYVATGSKDNTVNIYSLQGKKIRSLKGHQAAICCLAFIKGFSSDFLASGSDNGCGSVVLWDTKSWQIVNKIQAHQAAVTSIVDLLDGRHIVTGSYDKKINLFSITRNQRILSLNNCTSVTGMIMTCDRSKLVASGLDKTISVWNIIRKNGTVQDLLKQKVMPNQELVCQLQPSLIRQDIIFCACRDGSLKILNLTTSQIQRSFTVNANSLIQLIAIERQMNAENPLLISCSSKDTSLVVTQMDNGLSSLVKVAGGLGIDYGCGIGPKVVLSEARDGLIAIVNQSLDNKQFSLFELQLR